MENQTSNRTLKFRTQQQKLQDICDILNVRKIVPFDNDTVLFSSSSSEFFISWREDKWIVEVTAHETALEKLWPQFRV